LKSTLEEENMPNIQLDTMVEEKDVQDDSQNNEEMMHLFYAVTTMSLTSYHTKQLLEHVHTNQFASKLKELTREIVTEDGGKDQVKHKLEKMLAGYTCFLYRASCDDNGDNETEYKQLVIIVNTKANQEAIQYLRQLFHLYWFIIQAEHLTVEMSIEEATFNEVHYIDMYKSWQQNGPCNKIVIDESMQWSIEKIQGRICNALFYFNYSQDTNKALDAHYATTMQDYKQFMNLHHYDPVPVDASRDRLLSFWHFKTQEAFELAFCSK
jgi:hypothetical protein